MYAQRGYTLMELVLIMLVSSILLAGMAGLFTEAIDSIDNSEIKVVAMQLAQERMEQIIAERRADGYHTFSAAGDNITIDSYNYVRTIISSSYTGDACPTGMSCKEVQVVVSVDSITKAETTMLLVDY